LAMNSPTSTKVGIDVLHDINGHVESLPQISRLHFLLDLDACIMRGCLPDQLALVRRA